MLDKIQQYVTKDNHARVCRYLLSCADYISDETERAKLMEIVATAYRKCGELADSLRVAIKMNKQELVRGIFSESKG